MTVAELIEALKAMPQDRVVYRWDSDRSEDGSQTRRVDEVSLADIEVLTAPGEHFLGRDYVEVSRVVIF